MDLQESRVWHGLGYQVSRHRPLQNAPGKYYLKKKKITLPVPGTLYKATTGTCKGSAREWIGNGNDNFLTVFQAGFGGSERCGQVHPPQVDLWRTSPL